MPTLDLGSRSYELSQFEKGLLDRVKSLVDELPAGCARFEIGPNAGINADPKFGDAFGARSFRVTPTRIEAAPIRGTVMGDIPNPDGKGAEILLVVGQGSMREFAIHADSERAIKDIDLFLAICKAVFTTRFSEDALIDNEGKILHSTCQLIIDGRRYKLSSGTFIRKPFQGAAKRSWQYLPYFD